MMETHPFSEAAKCGADKHRVDMYLMAARRGEDVPADVALTLTAELAEAREDRDRYKRALEWAVLREPTGMRVALAATEDDD